MPWRKALTCLPAIVIVLTWKNFTSGGCLPRTFAMTFIAAGPWIWKR